MRILVTGASGTLGRAAVPALVRAGHQVRALSRRERDGQDATWVRGDLASGDGVKQAVRGCEALVHLATHGRKGPGAERVDVAGARTLVSAAREAGVAHLLYVTVVGADRAPSGLLRCKFEAERVVRESGLGYTVLRATHFHQWLDKLLREYAASPVLPVDRSVPWQPVHTGEVATHLTGLLAGGPRQQAVEFGGPQVLRTDELVDVWLEGRHLRRLCLSVRYPGRLLAAQRAGALITEATPRGRISWHDYLYPPPPVPSDDFASEHTASPTSPANQPEGDPDRHVYGGDEGYQRQTRR
ncbi:SDR family oxidoreductase [Nonomuraea sp. LPB2021202275-12-8]|uniref:SDR family oxidoreductase n=1 Tax=Nonomuraea sp. LPB2021202275-12-8 TaxID=3120159 RepID=UPI00300C350C